MDAVARLLAWGLGAFDGSRVALPRVLDVPDVWRSLAARTHSDSMWATRGTREIGCYGPTPRSWIQVLDAGPDRLAVQRRGSQIGWCGLDGFSCSTREHELNG